MVHVASCDRAVVLGAKKCVTRGYLHCSSPDIHLEAFSFCSTNRKPVICGLGLIRLL